MRDSTPSDRTASAVRNGSLTGRKCPRTSTTKSLDFAARRRAGRGTDCRTTRTRARSRRGIRFAARYGFVIDPDTLDCNKIFIPNAFTPGSSPGRNDLFGISNPFAVNEFISFEIFDRWGGRVFAAEDANSQWDGSAQGQPLNPGVYLYRLHYKCDGQERLKTGSLTLLR